jgi:putative endonuclease
MHRIDAPVRFDIVSVVKDAGTWKIEHFEDAFLPPHK